MVGISSCIWGLGGSHPFSTKTMLVLVHYLRTSCFLITREPSHYITHFFTPIVSSLAAVSSCPWLLSHNKKKIPDLVFFLVVLLSGPAKKWHHSGTRVSILKTDRENCMFTGEEQAEEGAKYWNAVCMVMLIDTIMASSSCLIATSLWSPTRSHTLRVCCSQWECALPNEQKPHSPSTLLSINPPTPGRREREFTRSSAAKQGRADDH